MERAYTVAEIDDLRNAMENRYLWGNANGPILDCQSSRCYQESEKIASVEQMVRTAMLAGLTARDYYEADKRPAAPLAASPMREGV